MTLELPDLLERFTNGPALIQRVLDEYPAQPVDSDGGDGWSVREVLVHLADAELVRSVRIRLILAEDAPALFTFDEGEWRERLSYALRDPDLSLRLYADAVAGTADLLTNADAAAWQREGVHPEDGRLSVVTLVERGIQHALDHAQQLREVLSR